jgi:hypothetical protein
MDVSERVTSAPTGGVDAGEVGDQADDDLRERLEQQQLARDPRAGTYGRMWRHNTLEGTDPIIELLEALRYRLPTEPATSSARSLLANLLDRKLDRGPSEASLGPPSILALVGEWHRRGCWSRLAGRDGSG